MTFSLLVAGILLTGVHRAVKKKSTDPKKLITTSHMRRVAAYQLALLLLQRSGRRLQSPKQQQTDCDNDEMEADGQLWKLGFRLRLTKMAFGYPRCDCKNSRTTKILKKEDIELPLATMDNALPTSIFIALRHSFRPDSKYWMEFYNKLNGSSDDISEPFQFETESGGDVGNQFASHNIKLPPLNPSNHPHSSLQLPSLLQQLSDSNSLLEQAAIITRHRLRHRFPRLDKATSVEIWSHRRQPDGHHQLHFDMDEIKLWEQKKNISKDDIDDCTTNGKRNSTCKKQKLAREHVGISCPIVSCVLTIDVPNHSVPCQFCGCCEDGAPTIICNQSILDNYSFERGDRKCNKGWLSHPHPNRLLAFEGSLLHGVLPGLRVVENSTPSYSDDDGDGREGYINSMQKGQFRVTLMMGFWDDGVCLTETREDENPSMAVGPNVPFPRLSEKACTGDNSHWVYEFKSVPVDKIEIKTGQNVEHTAENVTLLEPLWTQVVVDNADENEDGFGSYYSEFVGDDCSRKFYGRFFLDATTPLEIHNEILR
mmetsp:Transcript_29427/g.59191  ORF Transcript_29427/g.59191 Transcript_29427/m.59191 type:complete len:539 (+) Transcript_29427:196-1812(+)